MRILLVGSDDIWAIENMYKKYLASNNVEVALFPGHSIFYKYYNSSIIHKILFKAGRSAIFSSINTKYQKFVELFDPNIVLVFKGMELYPESIQWTKEKGITIANYNPDNPFLFSGKGSGNYNVSNSIRLYDLHFTYHKDVQSEIEKRYKLPVMMLPFGFDVSEQLYKDCSLQEEILKVAFVGNPDTQRSEFLMALAIAGVKTDVYGENWAKWIEHPNITILPPVYGDHLWATLSSYRVQLNLLRPHNLKSHNMRSFEVPGIGGIMLAPHTPDHQQYFLENHEIFLFHKPDDCVDKINFIMQLSKYEAKTIRLAARNRSMVSGYTYKDRARQLLNYFELKTF
jgi:spore maturation protein CgeB